MVGVVGPLLVIFVNGVIFGIRFDYNEIIIENNQPKYCRHMYPFNSLSSFQPIRYPLVRLDARSGCDLIATTFSNQIWVHSRLSFMGVSWHTNEEVIIEFNAEFSIYSIMQVCRDDAISDFPKKNV